MNDNDKRQIDMFVQHPSDPHLHWFALFEQTLIQQGLSLPQGCTPDIVASAPMQHCEWYPLSSIAQIVKGANLSSLKPGNVPILRGRDLRLARIEIKHLSHKDLHGSAMPFPTTELGDILVQKIGDRLATYLVSEAECGIGVSDTIFIIRLKHPDFTYARFLTALFNSSHGRSLLTREIRATTAITQSLKHLNRVEVPRPNIVVQRLLVEAAMFERRMHKEYESAAAFCSQLFELVGNLVSL